MTTAVYDRLTIPLTLIKAHLRLDDSIVLKLASLANVGSTSLTLDDVSELRVNDVVTVIGIDYRLLAVDYVLNQITLSQALTTTLPSGFQLTSHPDNQRLIYLANAAKQAADGYMCNEFLAGDGSQQSIPDGVLTWCLARIARQYHRSIEGLTNDTVTGLGSMQFGDEDKRVLWQWRKHPVIYQGL